MFEESFSFNISSSVTISGLDENTNYKIKIYAEQISSHLFSKSVDLSFTTKRSSTASNSVYFSISLSLCLFLVSKRIREITIRRITFTTIVITWLSDNFDQYQIRYWPVIDENKKILVTLLINNFTLTTTSDLYKFQIRARTKFGWTAYTEERLLSLRAMSIDQPASSNLTKRNVLLLLGPLVILGLLITAIIFALIFSRK